MNRFGSAWLLADRHLFHEMGAGFREKQQQFDATDVLLWILLPIGFFVLVGLLARLLARSDRHQLFNSPRRLFLHALPRSPVGSAGALVVGANCAGRGNRSAGEVVP